MGSHEFISQNKTSTTSPSNHSLGFPLTLLVLFGAVYSGLIQLNIRSNLVSLTRLFKYFSRIVFQRTVTYLFVTAYFFCFFVLSCNKYADAKKL